jgi:hypothetical protein
MPNCFDDVARAGFTLSADHGRAFAVRRRASPRLRATDERHFEITLIDVMLFIGGRKDFACRCSRPAPRIRFHEMADTRLAGNATVCIISRILEIGAMRATAVLADIEVRARAP